MGAVASCIGSLFHAIGGCLSAIVGGIGGALSAILAGIITALEWIIYIITFQWLCSDRGGLGDDNIKEDDIESFTNTSAATAAMRSSSCLQNVTAPSLSLLRFLKFQSEALCFFSQNTGLDFNSTTPRSFPPASRNASTNLLPPNVHTIGANLINLDFLFPPASGIKHNPHRSRKPLCLNKNLNLTAVGFRHASTEKRGWLRRLWPKSLKGRSRPGQKAPFESSSEPEMFSHGRNILIKAANEPKLRCTELDENGKVVLASGEFKKTELIARYGLLPRDLRKIDSSILPHILVRPSAILINLLHLRVLIKANRILVFNTYGSTDSHAQSAFMYELENRLRMPQNSPSAGGLPYEFRALEAILISVTSGLETEFDTVREPVKRVLRELEEDIDRDKLRHLLIYSKLLGTFEQKAKLVRDAIDELLEADDDLASMYLTEKSRDIIRGEDDHTEVEMLLESYHKVCDEIVQAAGNLVSSIRNTEEIVKAILDANRNSLMLLDLKFSIGTLGIGSGAFVAALYGMNLKNFIEEHNMGFGGISGFSFLVSALVFAWGLGKLRKVQRVSMWGEDGSGRRGGRGAWRHIDDEAARIDVIEGNRLRAERSRRLRSEREEARREGMGEWKR